eukprot:1158009-Pelagomonas_calceolata.AAC.1
MPAAPARHDKRHTCGRVGCLTLVHGGDHAKHGRTTDCRRLSNSSVRGKGAIWRLAAPLHFTHTHTHTHTHTPAWQLSAASPAAPSAAGQQRHVAVRPTAAPLHGVALRARVPGPASRNAHEPRKMCELHWPIKVKAAPHMLARVPGPANTNTHECKLRGCWAADCCASARSSATCVRARPCQRKAACAQNVKCLHETWRR